MSLLDSLGAFSSLFAQFQEDKGPSLLSDALAKTDLGGVSGILATLQQGGLAGEVESWLSSGNNLPITADQLRAVLSNEQVQQVAEHFGVPVDTALNLLTEHLPAVANQVSPDGSA